MFWPQRMDLLLETVQAKVCGVTYLSYDGVLKLTVPLILILALGLRSSVGPVHS